MKFSRNPSTGVLEAYTDEGIYVGNMATVNIDSVMSANDGGPGSGNFGHSGRPGKVGGSGPGGGKGSGSVYRYEKKGVGFFGTKKDWLNGLEGETQHNAARFLASKKKEMKESLDRAKVVRDLYLKGYLTLDEFEQKEKELGVHGLKEGSPVESYIVQKNDEKDVATLIMYAMRSRDWEKNKDSLIKNNLSDEEQKVLSYVEKTKPYGSLDNALRAKALAIPSGEIEIPEEILYKSGAKERPVPEGPDYGWYDNRQHYFSTIESNMGEAIGDPQYGKHWDKESFIKLNKQFVNAMKYGSLSPTKCRSAVEAMSRLRDASSAEKDENGFMNFDNFRATPEMVSRLSDEEKDRLIEIVNSLNPSRKVEDIADISDYMFDGAENEMKAMSLRTNEEKQMVRDYALIMEKMITGESPSDDDPYAAEREAKKKEEQEKHQKWVAQRDKDQEEFNNSPKAARKKEAIKKIKETTADQIKEMDSDQLREFMKSIMDKDFGDFVTTPLIPKEFYNTAATAIRDVMERFPFLAGELGGFGDPNSSAIAGCSIYAGEEKPDGSRGTEIVLNYNDFQNLPALGIRRYEATGRKWFVQTDVNLPDGYADIVHEMGHVLINFLHRYTKGALHVKKDGEGFFAMKYADTDVSILLKKKTMKACGIKTYEEIKNELSEYGAASRLNKGAGEKKVNNAADEFCAECICELLCSKNPRRVAVEFGKQLAQFIKDNNITEMCSGRMPSTRPNIVKDF